MGRSALPDSPSLTLSLITVPDPSHPSVRSREIQQSEAKRQPSAMNERGNLFFCYVYRRIMHVERERRGQKGK